MYCRNNKERLRRDWDKAFVEDMPGKILSYGSRPRLKPSSCYEFSWCWAAVVDPQVLKTLS